MKKLMILVVVVAVVVGGGWFLKQKATTVVADQMTRAINTPSGQQAIHDLLQSSKVQNAIAKYSAGGPQFKSQQQAVQFAASKLSPSQMATLASDYVHRNSLTPAQKDQIQQEMLSKFTPEQLAAMAKTFNN